MSKRIGDFTEDTAPSGDDDIETSKHGSAGSRRLKIKNVAGFPNDALWAGATGDGTAADESFLVSAAVAAGPTGEVVLRRGTFRVSNNATIDSNICFRPGAKVSVDSGKTLTINGEYTAGKKQQVFSGAGNVRFGNGHTEFRLEHFGVVADDGRAGADPGVDAVKIAALMALKVVAISNDAALQKCLNSLPGQGSTDVLELNRAKSVIARPTYYTFYGTSVCTNRRLHIYCPAGNQFGANFRTWSYAADAGGLTATPILHISGNPGTPPFYLTVSGEVTIDNIRFDAAPHFTTYDTPAIQVGGLLSAGVYTAQGASPVTGVNITNCSFAGLNAAVRFTYAGACNFRDNLIDGVYYGVYVTHGTQELLVEGNRFNGCYFYAVQAKALGVLTNAVGGTLSKISWLSVCDNKGSSYAGASYGGQDGGFDGFVQLIADTDNTIHVAEIKRNRYLGMGNLQDEHFGSDAKSAPVYAENVTDLSVEDNHFEEWPGNTQHWAHLIWVVGTTSNRIYERNNHWRITTTGVPFLLPSTVTETNIPDNMDVPIANNGTFAIPSIRYAEVSITEFSSSGETASYFCDAVGTVSKCQVRFQSGTVFTSTKDTASSFNFYWDSSLFQFTLQNLGGTTRTFKIRVRYI